MIEGVQIRSLRKEDFDYVVRVLDRWWGGPSGQRAEPFWFYEFGEDALVAEFNEEVVGFLMGFVREDMGYIHLVGIDPEWRRRGVGQALYQRFIQRCRERGVGRIKAIAAIGNDSSIAFHKALGFECVEDTDYAGPGRGRLVFDRTL